MSRRKSRPSHQPPLTPSSIARDTLLHGLKGAGVGTLWGIYQGLTSVDRGTPLILAVPKCIRPMLRYSFGFSLMMACYFGFRDVWSYWQWRQVEADMLRDASEDKRAAFHRYFDNRFTRHMHLMTSQSTVSNLAGSFFGGAAAGVIFGLITFERQRRNVITITVAAMVVALMSCSLQYHMLRRFHVPQSRQAVPLHQQRGMHDDNDEKTDEKTET